MKTLFLTSIFLFFELHCSAQQIADYKPLDITNPIAFGGDYIVYKGDTITLGPKAFFIDGQLTDEQVASHQYVFNSVNKAAENLTDGSEATPMVLYLAPYVYWIDNPDDPAIRVSENGAPPYGLIVKCEWLRFYGLNDKPENVVLASNRGQTIGAEGNFTMFKFIGDGTSSENITFGNYCNIDLEYPLKPALNREKRASAIVQAQLIHCNGDKIVARNTRFVSRLNLNPFVGGKRVLFDRCHFESTDDALCGTGVYLNSTLDFHSSKPFYRTTGTGAVFLNSDINVITSGNQYFTKANGQLGVVDTRFSSGSVTYLGWRDVTPLETRNYHYNVSLNGEPVIIGKKDPASTVDMSGKKILDAYRFPHKGKVIYNTYNLLSGNDGWDPMGIKETLLEAEKEQGKKYSMLPIQLLISPTRLTIETKKDEAHLNAKVLRFGNYEQKGETVSWSVAPAHESLVKLKVSSDGMSCVVIPINTRDKTVEVVIMASTPSGLEAASVIQVAPSILDAPQFSKTPEISLTKTGKLLLDYKLEMLFEDQSQVSWYRCTDAKGSNPIEVAVSRHNTPLLEYKLSAGDVGYHIMASVSPKHMRSDAGKAVSFVMKKPISAKDVKSNALVLYTDFKNQSTQNQPLVKAGFWTFDHFKSGEDEQSQIPNEGDAWYYGEGKDGAANSIGLLQGRSASMLYTPVGEKHGDMKLAMIVAPFKTAGQGFSIAHLYMDVLIKFDTETMSGYALRFIRTTKHHNAVDCIFVKYENGKVVEISEPVTTSSYITPCLITVEVNGSKIKARVTTLAANHSQNDKPEVVAEVSMGRTITPNPYGGFGILYNGGASAMINEMKVEWM